MLALVIVPLAVNIVLYILFFHYGSHTLDQWIHQLTGRFSENWPGWLGSIFFWVLKILEWLMLGLVAMLTFTIVGGIIAAPFNDYLSRATKKYWAKNIINENKTSPPINLKISETIHLEMKRILILIIGSLFALGMGLIPFLQIPALILGAYLVAFEYYGYPLSHQTPKLVPVWKFVLSHPVVSLGFGSFLLLMMALPFTSLIYIPLAVVGGTVIYNELSLRR